MEQKQWNTTWYNPGEEPTVESSCPKCPDGKVVSSQYGGFWCRNCKWKWKLSKWSDKGNQTEAQIQSENKRYDIFDVPAEIEKMNLRIDKVVLILKEKGLLD